MTTLFVAVSGEIPCSEDNNENTNKDMKIEADQVGEGEELSRPLPCQLMNSNINNAIRVEPLSRPNLRYLILMLVTRKSFS